MAIVDANIDSYRSRVFKGFVQFQDPDNITNYLRLREKQTLTTTYRFDRVAHYTDSGRKILDPNGYTHNFTMSIKLTADMIENTSPSTVPTDKSTISYWIYKNAIYEPVELVFVTTFEAINEVTPAAGDKFMHFKFRLDPNVFGPVTHNNQTGVNEITISGEITEITTVTRETSNTAPADQNSDKLWRPT